MVDFSKGLDGFFHSLIPVRLRESLNINTAAYFRARALSVMLMVTTLVPALATLVVGSAHLLFHPGLLKYDLVSLALVLVFGVQAGLFYKFNNYWLSGLAFTNFYFLLLALLIIVSGGYTSPMKAILLTCPIMSFMIGGMQEGIQNAVMSICFVLALMLLNVIDFELPDMFSALDPYMIFSVNWVGTVVIIAVCIMVYDMELQKHG